MYIWYVKKMKFLVVLDRGENVKIKSTVHNREEKRTVFKCLPFKVAFVKDVG